MEMTTPTGAAIATTLAAGFGPLPPMQIRTSGYGAGDNDFEDRANVLRVIIGEPSGATEAATVSVLEANIDDSSAEVLGYAMERLLAAGALDVSFSPIFMKKNRPGTLLRVVANPRDREAMAALVMAETTTLGLRHWHAERRVQARGTVEVTTPHGTVRVKTSEGGGFAPEYEDCRKLARGFRRPAQDDSRRREPRLPEQSNNEEVLPDDADLLRERGPAHRPRLYDLCRRPIRRLKRMQGFDVVLTSGTDEHGQKIEKRGARPGQVAPGVHRSDLGRVPRDSGRSSASCRTASAGPPIPSITRWSRSCSDAARRTATFIRVPTPAPTASPTSSTPTRPSPAMPARCAAAR